jgi:hypothetical protein
MATTTSLGMDVILALTGPAFGICIPAAAAASLLLAAVFVPPRLWAKDYTSNLSFRPQFQLPSEYSALLVQEAESAVKSWPHRRRRRLSV